MSGFHLPSLLASEVLARPGVRLIDVRKQPAALASGRILRNAHYIDPYTLNFDHPVLTLDAPLVFYCVHGHAVSQFAAALALVAGCEAYYVIGGFDALVAAGAQCQPFPQVNT